MNYGMRFMTLYRRWGSRPSSWKRNAKKAKWLSGEALQILVKRREAKSKGVKDMHALMKSLSNGLVGRKQEVKDKEELPDLFL